MPLEFSLTPDSIGGSVNKREAKEKPPFEREREEKGKKRQTITPPDCLMRWKDERREGKKKCKNKINAKRVVRRLV